jgi:uncharacterized membrane protein YdjX (TVP38/TMEM64 family)
VRDHPLNPAHRRALWLVLLVAVLLAIAAFEPLHQAIAARLDAAGDWIANHRAAGAVLFVVLAATSAMVAFFSSSVLVPAALQVWSATACLAMLWCGWIAGGVASYLIARYLGRPVVLRLASARTLARYEATVTNAASFGLVLLFQLAVPSELPGYVFGMVGYRFLTYLAALAIAELPYAIATVYASSAFLHRQLVPLVVLVVLAAILGAGTFHALKRHLAGKGQKEGTTPRSSAR